MVAQAVSLSKELGISVPVISEKLSGPVFEAQARQASFEKRYLDSLNASWKWLKFQPFSATPAIFGSFVASTHLEDYESAIKIALLAKRSTSDDFMLNNNLAFAYACSGDLDSAEILISALESSAKTNGNKAVLLATRGLIAFRRNNQAQGRAFYQAAQLIFQAENDNASFALATYFWAREEHKLDSDIHVRLFGEAMSLAKEHNLSIVLELPKIGE
jgi:tetratricopeptide (TPR) repeat protein